uniref:RNA binding motif protein 12Ba n=1 Tax=Fundulus heteroclitus TaxID=8078 RepID=A0A3Q2QPL1_FUNHE
MTTILRLEGLDVNAGTKDIRGFFEALHIPDGGVYIVGGSLGEAFIAFGTESEAQLALQRSGNLLKGSMVTLHLSSMEEMEKKLERSLKEKKTLLTADAGTALSDEVSNLEHASDSRPGYVRLFGLPASTTKDDICEFFKGLHVQEAIVNVELGISRGSLVKFASKQEATNALGFNQQLLGSTSVEVRGADEKMWEGALQECRNAIDDWNLPRNITKTDIKELFGCPGMPHKDVLHLLDETRSLTDTAFLTFKRPEDFDYAINLSGCHVGSGNIEVTPITKNVMWEMMAKNHPRNQRTGPTDPRLHAARRHIFIRNMPANVKRSQIRSLFCKFNLCLGDIVLLQDGEGGGRGEAVVTFESEEQAALAQTMHGEEFLGTKVLLTRINIYFFFTGDLSHPGHRKQC